MAARLLPLLLLLGFTIFMTFAWYGHLKYKTSPLLVAIVASWGIAFFEYTLMAGQPSGQHGLFGGATEDDPGKPDLAGVRGILYLVSGPAAEMASLRSL